MRSLSQRARLSLLWTATCVALAGLSQMATTLVDTHHQGAAANPPHAVAGWLTPFTADGGPGVPGARPAAARESPGAPSLPLAEVATRAMARITYPWQRLGYRIVFAPGRPGLRGETVPGDRRIVIYVTPGEPESLVTHVIAHEVGHAVDFTYNDGARRARWLQLRGIRPGTAWFGCSGCADFATPAGDFAETFAYWQVGDADYSQLAAPPDPAQMPTLAALFYPSAPQPAPSPPAPAADQPAPAPAGGTTPALLCVDSLCTG